MQFKSKETVGNYFKFKEIGDQVEGTFVEFQKGVEGTYGPENNLVLKTKDGPTLIRCPTKLTGIISEHIDHFVRGASVKVAYIGDIPTNKGNPMKDFTVDVEPAGPHDDEENPF